MAGRGLLDVASAPQPESGTADALGPTGGGSRASVPGSAAGAAAGGRFRDWGVAAGGRFRDWGVAAGGRFRDWGVAAGGRFRDWGVAAGGRVPQLGAAAVESAGSVVLTSESRPGVTRTVRSRLPAGSSRKPPASTRSGRGSAWVIRRVFTGSALGFAMLRQPDRALGTGRGPGGASSRARRSKLAGQEEQARGPGGASSRARRSGLARATRSGLAGQEPRCSRYTLSVQ
jgi:hypothetical protein